MNMQNKGQPVYTLEVNKFVAHLNKDGVYSKTSLVQVEAHKPSSEVVEMELDQLSVFVKNYEHNKNADSLVMNTAVEGVKDHFMMTVVTCVGIVAANGQAIDPSLTGKMFARALDRIDQNIENTLEQSVARKGQRRTYGGFEMGDDNSGVTALSM